MPKLTITVTDENGFQLSQHTVDVPTDDVAPPDTPPVSEPAPDEPEVEEPALEEPATPTLHVDLVPDVQSQWDDGAVIEVTLTNRDDAPLFNPNVVFNVAGEIARDDCWGAQLLENTSPNFRVQFTKTQLAKGESDSFKFKVTSQGGLVPENYEVVADNPEPVENVRNAPLEGTQAISRGDIEKHPYSEPKQLLQPSAAESGARPTIAIHPSTDSFEHFLKEDFPTALAWGEENTHVLLRDETPDGNRGFRTIVKANTSSPSDNGKGGTGWEGPACRAETATLRYMVRFEDGFDFVLGGKLPGLGGGTTPSGHRSTDAGWTMRWMWREAGQVELYGYFMNKLKSSGDSLGRGLAKFEPGVWHTLEQQIILNTVDESGLIYPDGVARAWFDGRPVFEIDGIVYRQSRDVLIDTLMYTIFFGGTGPKWRSPRDQIIDTAGYRIFT